MTGNKPCLKVGGGVTLFTDKSVYMQTIYIYADLTQFGINRMAGGC